MSIDIHFSEADWERIERDWSAWWAGELPRPLVLIQQEVRAPGKGLPRVPKFQSNFPLSMPPEIVIDKITAHLQATRWHGDAFPKWFVNFGPGILAGFLGMKVNSVRDTVWFEHAAAVSIDRVEPVYDGENVWWRRVLDLTRAAVERWGPSVAVSHTDLGGNLDVVASMRTTEQLLFDLTDTPGEVDRIVREVTSLWLRYYRELDAIIQRGGRGTTPWAAIWSPKRCYMLQCDFSYMISPQMFERFVMPDLAACCDYLDHAFYHLDGKGEIPHLDMLLSLQRLRGIQWIPGAGSPTAARWPSLLKRIRDAGKLCQVYVSPRGARRIVRELGGRGFALSINESMTKNESEDFLRLLAREDARR
jgi:hypothetical protein